MIKIEVKTDGKKILDSFEEDNPTFKECALVSYRLGQIITYLQAKEFKSEFEVKEGDFAKEGEE